MHHPPFTPQPIQGPIPHKAMALQGPLHQCALPRGQCKRHWGQAATRASMMHRRPRRARGPTILHWYHLLHLHTGPSRAHWHTLCGQGALGQQPRLQMEPNEGHVALGGDRVQHGDVQRVGGPQLIPQRHALHSQSALQGVQPERGLALLVLQLLAFFPFLLVAEA